MYTSKNVKFGHVHTLAVFLLVGRLFVPGAWAQQERIAPDIIAQMELANPERALALAFRFAPGPEGLGFIVIDPDDVDDGADRSQRVDLSRMHLYLPGQSDGSGLRRLSVRQSGGSYSFAPVRLTARHEGTTVEFNMEGALRSLTLSRYLETTDLTVRGWLKLSGRMTYQGADGRARFLVSRDNWMSENQFRGGQSALSVRNLTATPVMELRAVEGGRLVVANLVLGHLSGRARSWTYFFPLQDADSQIRVEAVDERGAVIETIQLRNTGGGFDQLDSWTGRFRRLQAGRRYTLRATVDLGMLGKLEQTIPITVFDY